MRIAPLTSSPEGRACVGDDEFARKLYPTIGVRGRPHVLVMQKGRSFPAPVKFVEIPRLVMEEAEVRLDPEFQREDAISCWTVRL